MRRPIIVLALAALTVAALAWAQTGVSLSINFADAAVYQEVEDAVCSHYGYADTVTVIVDGEPVQQPNPEKRKAFVRRQLKRFALDHRSAYLDSLAAEAGKAAGKVGRKAETEAP